MVRTLSQESAPAFIPFVPGSDFSSYSAGHPDRCVSKTEGAELGYRVAGSCMLAIFEAYTGYLLPMDQLALWASQTGMELVNTIPFGALVHGILVPDGVGQPMSLLRFYVLHIALVPLTVLILTFLHFYRIRKGKGVLPYL